MKFRVISVFAIAFSFTGMAHGAQTISVKDGETVPVQISANDPNRIAIVNGRIKTVAGSEGKVTVKPNKVTGELLVTVEPQYKSSPVTIFVTDMELRTVALLMTPKAIPAETVFLKFAGSPRTAVTWENSAPYQELLTNIIIGMRRDQRGEPAGKGLTGFAREDLSAEIPLWEEAKTKFVSRYVGKALVGEVYVLENVSKVPMVLAEPEFGRNALVVSIDKPRLQPGESSRVYLIREGGV